MWPSHYFLLDHPALDHLAFWCFPAVPTDPIAFSPLATWNITEELSLIPASRFFLSIILGLCLSLPATHSLGLQSMMGYRDTLTTPEIKPHAQTHTYSDLVWTASYFGWFTDCGVFIGLRLIGSNKETASYVCEKWSNTLLGSWICLVLIMFVGLFCFFLIGLAVS